MFEKRRLNKKKKKREAGGDERGRERQTAQKDLVRIAGLGPQRMLSQLGRMGRDRAATGLLHAFMLLIQVGSREPQWLGLSAPVPTLFMASKDHVRTAERMGRQERGAGAGGEGGGELFFTSLESEHAFVQKRQSGGLSVFSKHWQRPLSHLVIVPQPTHPL